MELDPFLKLYASGVHVYILVLSIGLCCYCKLAVGIDCPNLRASDRRPSGCASIRRGAMGRQDPKSRRGRPSRALLALPPGRSPSEEKGTDPEESEDNRPLVATQRGRSPSLQYTDGTAVTNAGRKRRKRQVSSSASPPARQPSPRRRSQAPMRRAPSKPVRDKDICYLCGDPIAETDERYRHLNAHYLCGCANKARDRITSGNQKVCTFVDVFFESFASFVYYCKSIYETFV